MSQQQVQIQYALVARKHTPLAEHALQDLVGNLAKIGNQLLLNAKAPPQGQTAVFVQDEHIFHVLAQGEFTYIALADAKAGKVAPTKFLKQVASAFEQQCGERAKKAPVMGCDEVFKPTLKNIMAQKFAPGNEKIDAINQEIAQAKQIMEKNIGECIGLRFGLLKCF
jgi:hypothetical protein